MILWRHLYGAVTNAAYAKPFLPYDLTKSIMFKVANITSFAIKPVSTPGNCDVLRHRVQRRPRLHGHRIFAGVSYGVLFPFSALMRTPSTTPATAARASVRTRHQRQHNVGDGGTAHTIQMRLVLGF